MNSVPQSHAHPTTPDNTACFAYVRVSTAKQREHGVSLDAQREAIERYAGRNGLSVTEWFSESQTAAKRGRAEFDRMLRLLRRGKAGGVIVHKIDRSARNLKDWADFADLADLGVAIHFAAEALDLSSRGGRLSADIQAVVAADYIRNLRQEALKGIHGRYRQGLLPRQAPVGYVDNGGGNAKTVDPVTGPLVREAFERYATGRYSLDRLHPLMARRGLRNKRGQVLRKNGFSLILRNPFYVGVIGVRRTGEVYEGRHEPLVTRSLFDAVQDVLDGRKQQKKAHRHEFTFRKLLRCASCSRNLIAERQKGHVYYRCQTRGCPLKCVREEAVESALHAALERVSLAEDEGLALISTFRVILGERGTLSESRRRSLELEIGRAGERLGRLTDLLLDGVLDEGSYHEKKHSLIERKQQLAEQLGALTANPAHIEQRLVRYLERATRASLSYERANPAQKREMVELFTSNRTVSPENVAVELREPFQTLAMRDAVSCCGPLRDAPRTFTPSHRLIEKMIAHVEEEMKAE